MAKDNTEQINSKSLIRIAKVVRIEDNLNVATKNEISRNCFGRRIKVRLFEDEKTLKDDELPWVWPLLPKHLQVIPKENEMVLVFLQNLDGAQGNRFYIGPIISQDYYLDNGGTFEALSLMQGLSTNPLCHPQGNSKNDGSYPDSDTIAIQGRGDSAMWLKDEELRLMCGHKPNWRERSIIENADPGSLEFNRENLAYIQMKYGKFKDGANNDFNSVINVVADRINLMTHGGAPNIDQKELITKESIEKFVTDGQCMVLGDELISFLEKFRKVFSEHTHHFFNDKQVICSKDDDFWNKNLEELLCKKIRIV